MVICIFYFRNKANMSIINSDRVNVIVKNIQTKIGDIGTKDLPKLVKNRVGKPFGPEEAILFMLLIAK